MTPGRDAQAFFELLYGPKPPGQILICETADKRWSTHICKQPADAAQHVLGHVDVYHRVGLVDHKPPLGKRGDESFTTALTAIWLDIDVDGSPDGKGGTVTNAAPSLEAAIELHHSVLEPTFIVGSGYGAHGYLGLAEPWLLHDSDARRQAKAIVRGWHERIKREAVARGMAKFDSVFDLARVLRPVGSLNGKGNRPVLVELLDDGGPRYTIEQIAAEAVTIDTPHPVEPSTDEEARPLEELLDEFPVLAKIIAREGGAPGDGTGHTWDFSLCCEAIRCGCNDTELGVLVRHARSVHPDPSHKGDRRDYVERTIAAARATAEEETADPARVISSRWNLGDDPIEAGEIVGGTIAHLRRRSGRRLRIPNVDDLFQAAKHTRVISRVAKTQFPPLTNAQAVQIAQQLIALCTGADPDPLEEARIWVSEFIAGAGKLIEAAGRTRRKVLEELLKAEDELKINRDPARRTAILVDSRGEYWLPAGALKAHSGARTSWDEFSAQLLEIGWRQERLQASDPRVSRKFYVGTQS